MHLLMILTIGLNSSWLNSISAYVCLLANESPNPKTNHVGYSAPPILCIIVFKIVLNSKFGAKRWNYYIPTDAEIAAAHAHHSDERKHRLARRFGHPSLHAPLITPLIHASAQHMLSTVYSGRIASTDTDATNAHGIKAGGINFGAVEKVFYITVTRSLLLVLIKACYRMTSSCHAMTICVSKMRGKLVAWHRPPYWTTGQGQVLGPGDPVQWPPMHRPALRPLQCSITNTSHMGLLALNLWIPWSWVLCPSGVNRKSS